MPRWQQCREVKQTSQVHDVQHDEEDASNTAIQKKKKAC